MKDREELLNSSHFLRPSATEHGVQQSRHPEKFDAPVVLMHDGIGTKSRGSGPHFNPMPPSQQAHPCPVPPAIAAKGKGARVGIFLVPFRGCDRG